MEVPPFWILWQYLTLYQRDGMEWAKEKES